MIVTHARVIIVREIPEESVLPGDVGTVIEEYRDAQGTITGYSTDCLPDKGS